MVHLYWKIIFSVTSKYAISFEKSFTKKESKKEKNQVEYSWRHQKKL